MLKLKRFWHWSTEEKRYFLLAYYWLAVYSLRLKTTPFKKLIALSLQSPRKNRTSLTPQRIGQLIRTARKYSPFPCLCLVQALTARRLLTQLGFEPIITLGVNKAGENNTMKAHAWCKVGRFFVTGGDVHAQFAAIETL